MESEAALLTLRNISVRSHQNWLIHDINLELHRREIVTLIGPNGAGKSTLIKTALGLIRPTTGERSIKPSLRVGYVPQSVSIDDSLPLTVERFLKLSPGIGEIQMELCAQLNIDKLLATPLQHISGGEMRRVLLARALQLEPELLILDEPTSGVDISGQAKLYDLIQTIRDETSCGILLVSHDLHVVMAATDRVLCLNKHVCCSGTPEQVQKDPEFIALFPQDNANSQFAIYRHVHDHTHDSHGHVHLHDN